MILFRVRTFLCCLLSLFLAAPAGTGQNQSPKQNQMKQEKRLQQGVQGAFGTKPGAVGMVMVDGNLFVEAIVIHGDRVFSGIFYLDTRTSTPCVMNTLFAEKVEVMGLGNITLKLGEEEIKNVKATVLDHPNLQRIYQANTALFQNRPIAGIIGYPTLAARRTVLDFADLELRFEPPAEKWKEGVPPELAGIKDRKVIPYRDESKTPWLDVKLNDKLEGVFHLSTGSPFSWIRKDLAEQAGLRRGKSPRSLTVMGAELPAETLDLRVLKVAPEYNGLPFPVAGCLGNDFLCQFRVTFDAVNKHLILDPVRKK